MVFWLVLGMMICAAIVLLSVPSWRRFEQPQVPERDIEAYCAQLTEIARKAAAGLIDRTQADSACAEIKRALMADRAPPAAALSLGQRNRAAVAVACFMALGSVALYALSGGSDLPFAAGKADFSRAGASAVDQLAAATQGATGLPETAARPRLGSVDEMIARLTERLKRSPDDAEGWRMLGWSYFNTERFPQAAGAYAKAIALDPQSADYRSARGEALVRAADGRVSEEAKAVFVEALRLDPKDPRGRFFLGLAKAQAGDKQAALDEWIAILNETDASDSSDQSWVGDLRQRVAELGQETGVDISKRLDRAPAEPNGSLLAMLQHQEQAAPDVAAPRLAAPNQGGPTAADIRAAEGMQPGERTAMIEGMVDRLASRLSQSPRDVEGWIRLMRSRQLLGDADAAEQTFRSALDVFKDAAPEQERISAAARQLGLIK
jgi:cytochrome c-type biogenesis protein CcmH